MKQEWEFVMHPPLEWVAPTPVWVLVSQMKVPMRYMLMMAPVWPPRPPAMLEDPAGHVLPRPRLESSSMGVHTCSEEPPR